jgi:DNA-binding CsgD family transcriptional regulator
VITIGVAMAGANIALGLVTIVHFPTHSSLSIAAAFTGLGPLLGALYIGSSYLGAGMPATERLEIKKAGLGLTVSIIAFAAAAYFSGGLWFRAIMPIFYSRWPTIIGIDIFIYAAAIAMLLFFALKRSYIWAGLIALSLLGLGYTTAIFGLEQPWVLVVTVVLLNVGMAATDFFFWLALRGLSNIMGDRKVFGIGLGLSLFFITGTGIALDAIVIPSPLQSPAAAALGASLLFIICPFLIWFVRPLQFFEEEISREIVPEQPEPIKIYPALPAFWNDLTSSEKKVYELISHGHTDGEIAKTLFISRHTVKFHVRNVLRKAGVSNRKELLLKTLHELLS